jgi:CBS domain-containing protein
MSDTLAALEIARKVLRTEAAAILGLVDRINDDFERAVQLLYECRGRVIVTGMGKSGIICRKIAATLSSTGTSAWFLHPAEAIHGDLGAIREDDVVLALSHSGETEEILKLLESIRRTGAKIIALTVRTSTRMPDVIHEMSSKRLGMACVVDDEGRLVGVVTDGDLRRLMSRTPDVGSRTAAEVMTPNPITIPRSVLAVEALKVMETHKITAVIVTDAQRAVEGVVHLHDLWRTQMI